jgi:lipopolysaccharide export LptBFGC system permease protein LptF
VKIVDNLETQVPKESPRGFSKKTYRIASRILGIIVVTLFISGVGGIIGMNVVPWMRQKLRERREGGIRLEL